MPLPIISSPAPYAGLSGSPFGAQQSVTLAASGTHLLPAGEWYVACGTQDHVNLAVTGSINQSLVLAAGAGRVTSDGTNVSIVNSGTVGTATTFVQVLGV